MNYKAIKAEIDGAYFTIFNLYEEAIKNYMRENAEQTNPFIETLWLDISEDEVVYQSNYDREDTTIDKLYYIPSKDELGYVIYQAYTDNVYAQGPFKLCDRSALASIFYCKCLEYGSIK